MALFLELIQGDPSMDSAVEEARVEYFQGGAGFAGDPRSAPAAEVRFLEWLLFERDLDGGLLVERLLPAWREAAGPDLAVFESTFLGTSAGIFEVGAEAGGGLHWLRDVAGLGEFAVEVRVMDGQPVEGDLIVGRLFPTGDSVHVLSPGAGCFRDQGLIDAVYRDLERARQDRSHQSLRIRQEDLEAMFWGDALQPEEPSDPVSELREFLVDGGLGSDEVDGVLEALSRRPLPSDVSGPFFISAIQDLLEHLAFETELDLSAAQGKFVACWIHLQGGGVLTEAHSEASESQASSSPKVALQAFDEDRAAGIDAETAISRLTARLGLQDEGALDPAMVDDVAPEGLIDGLIEEYCWELSRLGDGVDPSHQHALELLRERHRHTELVEELTPRSLLLFACTRVMEQGGRGGEPLSGDAAAVDAFASWCVENQGHLEDPEASKAFGSLPQSAQRISAINDHCSPAQISGDWLQVWRSDGLLEGVASSGDRYELNASDEVCALLQSGDYVRASVSGDMAVVRWCYPPELSAAQ